MDDVYNNINEYKTNRTRKKIVLFHDMIADILTN